ncbi:unnamed protein product [Penicillium salamii]|uniref:F-box domain-containing protein n=1 Tax=Penicillium salamii TaxID=1612424 RepID=A0A9W4JMJ8_9EURO|nr:unnamed protein product [Penicillium salamii]CAG8264203.1 unnamed protein product [Penicillium salamii]CAG8337747.1 unnamed protein product [Penicillium salamii]CAG8341998.1 unnamed protein product [Penicillium salamii]CAG8353844.1 unnamed protein product [Penicillium salamii]
MCPSACLHFPTFVLLHLWLPPVLTMDSFRMPVGIETLPLELQEAILDLIFNRKPPVRLAHGETPKPRIPQLRDPLAILAQVRPQWRAIIQSRLYSHIKIKASVAGLRECKEWFTKHPYLGEHVNHIEFWLPVWGALNPDGNPVGRPQRLTAAMTPDGKLTFIDQTKYPTAQDNASLNEIFRVVKRFFPSATTITIDGGAKHQTRPAEIRFDLDSDGTILLPLAKLDQIRTLVMRGAWNVVRRWETWRVIEEALPNMTGLHCFYSHAHNGNYMTTLYLAADFPEKLQHLNLTLEGFSDIRDNIHNSIPKPILLPICQSLGVAAYQLETLTFTGRVCTDFFNALLCHARRVRVGTSPLQSIDITVKGCCFHRVAQDEYSNDRVVTYQLAGLSNMSFIRSFHSLVCEGLKALAVLPKVNYLRIRFIDMDSQLPMQNPYFELKGDWCTGLWSGPILRLLGNCRPHASFVELSNGIEPVYEDGELLDVQHVRSRPLGIRAQQYMILEELDRLYPQEPEQPEQSEFSEESEESEHSEHSEQ